jgi:hypothetical protein
MTEQKPLKPRTDVKRLDFNKNQFQANGKTYFIDGATPLTVGRFRKYEGLVNQSTFGSDFAGINETFKKIYNTLTGNDGQGMNALKAINDAANMALNMSANIVKRTEQKDHYALLLCTLFLNTSDEDLTGWDLALANDKIKDWEIEGIAMSDFFLLATNLVVGLKEIYQGPWLEALQKKITKDEYEEAERKETERILSKSKH